MRTFASTTSGCLRENVARIVSRTASGSMNGQALTTAPSIAVFTRVRSSTAMPSASSVATVADSNPSVRRIVSGEEVVLTITVPPGARPATEAGESARAAWKIAISCGVSTGLLTRIARPASQKRTNDFTGVPFFSEPYEEKCEPFSPCRSTPASASIWPAR